MTETTNPQATITPEEQAAHIQKLVNFDKEISTINPKTLLESIEHVKGGLIRIGIDHLRVMPDFNVRIRDAAYYEHIQSLKQSILEEGFYEDKPLAGVASYEGKEPVIFVTDGDCRLQAVKLAIAEGAPIQSVPVVLKDRTTTIEDLTIALVRSNGGKRFTPLELSVVARRLQKFAWTEKTIAAKLGFSEEYVKQLLTASGAPVVIRQMIAEGEVPLAVAVQSIRTHGPEEAKQVLQTAVAQAKERGETKITRKDLPEQIYKKTITKNAPKLVGIIEKIHAEPLFKQLPEELKLEISEFLASMAVAKAAGAKQDEQACATGTGNGGETTDASTEHCGATPEQMNATEATESAT